MLVLCCVCFEADKHSSSYTVRTLYIVPLDDIVMLDITAAVGP